MTEGFNRNIRGFDETSPSPIEAQAKAAYALKPIPEVPVDQFKLRDNIQSDQPAAQRPDWSEDYLLILRNLVRRHKKRMDFRTDVFR
jgi:hypothetical protein